MESMVYQYRPIGWLRTPFAEPRQAPIQPCGAADAPGRAELNPELVPALADLDGFSHLVLLYHFHQAGAFKPLVRPFLDQDQRGLFATRAPARPNPIGLSVVRLLSIEGACLHLAGVDMLDGSPLLDLKPLVPAFDCPSGPVRVGWLTDKLVAAADSRGDERFCPD